MHAAKVEGRVKRISLFLGPGGGKSRIAATIGWMSLNSKLFTKVTFIYPNEYIRSREESNFK